MLKAKLTKMLINHTNGGREENNWPKSLPSSDYLLKIKEEKNSTHVF